MRHRIAVVDLAARHLARHRHGFRRDAGSQTGRVDHRVVAGRASTVEQGRAADRHGLRVARVLVGKRRRLPANGQRFALHQADQAATKQLRHRIAVVDFAARHLARHRHGFRRDAGRQTGRVDHRVVAGRTSPVQQGRAADRHGFRIARVLVGKRRRLAGEAQGFALHQADQAAATDLRHRIAVVDLAARHLARHCQGFRRDIGRAAGSIATQNVVARVRTSQRDTANRDNLGRARILVAEQARASNTQAVVANNAIKACRSLQGGRSQAIIALVVHAHVRHAADRCLGNIGHAAGRRAGQNVVARIHATQGDVADVHCFTGARVLVAEFAISRHRQAVVAEDAGEGRRAIQGGRFLAIIGLVVDTHVRHAADAGLGDVGHAAGRRATQNVVARVRAAQGDVADIHRFTGARALVAEDAAAGHRQTVTVHLAIKHCTAVQGRRGQAIIGLVVDTHVRHAADAGLGDVGHAAGRRATQDVVARVRAAQDDVADVHCFTRARILVAEFAISRHRQAVGTDDASEGRRAIQGGRFLAIIGLVVDAHVRHAVDGCLGNIRRHPAGVAEGVVAGQAGGAIRDGRARHGDDLAAARVLVGENAGLVRHIQVQRLTTKQAAQCAARQHGIARAVIVAVCRRHARHRQRFRRDSARHAAGIAEDVVAGQAGGAIRDGRTRHGDDLAAARVLVGENAGLVRQVQVQRLTTDQAVQCAARQRGQLRAVIVAACRRHARHRQRFLRDIRHAAGYRAGQRIVARVRTAQGDVADVHCFTGARILVAEQAIAGDTQAVGADDAAEGRRAIQGGRFLAIIGLVVDAHVRHAVDGCLGNIRRHPAGIAEGIVAGQAGGAIRDGRARHGDDLAAARVLVGENAGLVRQIQVQRLTTKQAAQCAARQHGIARAVIVAVCRRHARHRQRFLRDSARHAAGIAEGVVAGQACGAIRDGRTRHGDDLAAARVLVGENAGLVRQVQVQRLAADQAAQCAARQRGQLRAVIVAACRRHARHRHGLGRNHQAAIDIADRIAGLAARRVQAAGRHAIAADIHGA